MFDRILIAVDGSSCSRRAAAYGLGVASAYDAAVDVVHAVEPGTLEDEAVHRQRRERGEELLDAVTGLAGGLDVDVETQLVEGNVPASLVSHIDDHGADLVVLGRQGKGGLGERLLGSVAERVLRGTDVPVLVVPGVDPLDPEETSFERVLATTDGSETAERAAPVAADVARKYGASLHAVTVVDVEAEAGVFDAGGVTEEYVERLEERGEEYVDSFSDRVRETAPDVTVKSAVLRGVPHLALEEYTVANDIDLLVLASVGESSLAGHLLGSTADRLLRVVEVPVLVIPGAD